MHYRPNIFSLIREFFAVIWSILRAPKLQLTDNCVVVIMDPIDAYKDLYSCTDISNINRLIEYANKKDVPVIITRWIRIKPEKPLDEIDIKGHWSCFIPEKQSGIIKDIENEHHIVIPVKHTNAFMHSEFSEIISEKKHVILAGCWLESCIINTARTAIDMNHKVSVVSNCSTGHFPFKYISLFDIQMVYGKIVNI